jgi:hypothetical protein
MSELVISVSGAKTIRTIEPISADRALLGRDPMDGPLGLGDEVGPDDPCR